MVIKGGKIVSSSHSEVEEVKSGVDFVLDRECMNRDWTDRPERFGNYPEMLVKEVPESGVGGSLKMLSSRREFLTLFGPAACTWGVPLEVGIERLVQRRSA